MTLAGEEKGLILKAITPEPKENVEWPYRPMQADARDVKFETSDDVARLCFLCAQIALYESSIVLGSNWMFKRDVLTEAGFSYAKATEEDGKECLLHSALLIITAVHVLSHTLIAASGTYCAR